MPAPQIMSPAVARPLLLGQLCLFVFLFVCFLLIPHFLLEPNQGGVSNYGLYAKTVVPYTLGFGLCGALTLYAARRAAGRRGQCARLARPLKVLGALYFVALASTYGYKLSPVMDHAHVYASAALVVFQLLLGTWLALRLAPDHFNHVLLATQYVGFSFGILNYFGIVHILFVIELFTSLAFAVLLIRTALLLCR